MSAQGLVMRHQLAMHYLDTVARVGSIRKAAEQLAITSSALNRRIIAMEEDLGVPIFDRIASGVRLNAAGEILIHHFRTQLAEMERVKSQIHDLQGERRGHVSIACSQALMVSILPQEIKKYRSQHPGVTFSLRVCTRQSALDELKSFNADIALVFEPELSTDFESVLTKPQRMYALLPKTHPLNRDENGNQLSLEKHPNDDVPLNDDVKLDELRLRDCLEYSLALPTINNGVRHLLELAAARLSTRLDIAIESDNSYLLHRLIEQGNLLSFVAEAGIQSSDTNVFSHRPINNNDMPEGSLHIGKLKGRHLPVAASKFLEQLCETVSA